MLKQKKFIIGGVIILLAVGVLSFMAFKGAATYYYTVKEVLSQKSTMLDKNIRVAGRVVEGSVVKEQSNTINFVLTDVTDSSQKIAITYKGAVPDAFKEGNDAIIEGKLSGSEVFTAQQIIVKCPSKYEAKQ